MPPFPGCSRCPSQLFFTLKTRSALSFLCFCAWRCSPNPLCASQWDKGEKSFPCPANSLSPHSLPLWQTLLPAASLLQLNGVRDACCKFLLSQLDPSNCLGIRGFADTHSCSDLLKSAHKYVLQHFVEVSKTEEFMLLPLKQVRPRWQRAGLGAAKLFLLCL